MMHLRLPDRIKLYHLSTIQFQMHHARMLRVVHKLILLHHI